MVVVMVEETLSTTTTTTTEPPEFVAIMAQVGRFHPRMRRWFLKRYYENPAGFALTADESRDGRNPPGRSTPSSAPGCTSRPHRRRRRTGTGSRRGG